MKSEPRLQWLQGTAAARAPLPCRVYLFPRAAAVAPTADPQPVAELAALRRSMRRPSPRIWGRMLTLRLSRRTVDPDLWGRILTKLHARYPVG